MNISKEWKLFSKFGFPALSARSSLLTASPAIFALEAIVETRKHCDGGTEVTVSLPQRNLNRKENSQSIQLYVNLTQVGVIREVETPTVEKILSSNWPVG